MYPALEPEFWTMDINRGFKTDIPDEGTREAMIQSGWIMVQVLFFKVRNLGVKYILSFND